MAVIDYVSSSSSRIVVVFDRPLTKQNQKKPFLIEWQQHSPAFVAKLSFYVPRFIGSSLSSLSLSLPPSLSLSLSSWGDPVRLTGLQNPITLSLLSLSISLSPLSLSSWGDPVRLTGLQNPITLSLSLRSYFMSRVLSVQMSRWHILICRQRLKQKLTEQSSHSFRTRCPSDSTRNAPPWERQLSLWNWPM